MNPSSAPKTPERRSEQANSASRKRRGGGRESNAQITNCSPKGKSSLKDLNPEDKKRVANLIRELAKVGEEKEVIVLQLDVERRTFEHKVVKLKKRITLMNKEQELTQRQYVEGRKLLAEYEAKLVERPSTPHRKANETPVELGGSPVHYHVPHGNQEQNDRALYNGGFYHPSPDQNKWVRETRQGEYSNQEPISPGGFQEASELHGFTPLLTSTNRPCNPYQTQPWTVPSDPGIQLYPPEMPWVNPDVFHPLQPESQGSDSPGVWGYSKAVDVPSNPWPDQQPHPLANVINDNARLNNERCRILAQQREQLHAEQAWLQRQLAEQETRLLHKQAQIERHKLDKLQQELRQRRLPASSTDEYPTESENGEGTSTNFPPDSFNVSARVLGNGTTSELSPGRSRAGIRRTRSDPSRRGCTAEEEHDKIEGRITLYPNTRNAQESSSPRSPHKSRLTPSKPTLVDQATSPIKKPVDISALPRMIVDTTPKVNLSPGHVNVTPAPRQRLHNARLMGNRPVRLPERRRAHSYRQDTDGSTASSLSALIAGMEVSSDIRKPRTNHRPPKTHNRSARRTADTTPDLFDDADLQESRILEDVFFL